MIMAVTAAAGTLLTGCSSARGQDQEGFVGGSGAYTWVEPEDRVEAGIAEGPELGGEGTLSTADFDGEVVVVNVWGSWCAPCRKEAPDLVAAAEQTEEVAQFVGINTQDANPAPAEAFVRAFEVNYPSIHDPNGSALLAFSGVLPPSAIPSTLVIDTEGRVAARVLGEVDTNTLVGLVDDVVDGG
ncbi:MAG: TlpA family protein disulfide reductase [Propionibacteriaceae bacterium]